jgi:hypothetical protein
LNQSTSNTLRTTINIDDQLLISAKLRAVEGGVSLGRINEEVLRQSLAQPAQEKNPMRLITMLGTGTKQGVDLDNGRAL